MCPPLVGVRRVAGLARCNMERPHRVPTHRQCNFNAHTQREGRCAPLGCAPIGAMDSCNSAVCTRKGSVVCGNCVGCCERAENRSISKFNWLSGLQTHYIVNHISSQPLTPHCHRRNARTADARMAVFQMGSHTHAISMTLYRDNRMKVVNELQRAHNFGADSKPVILLQGGDNISHYDTDVDYVFRQESYFTYLFGVTEPGCYGTVEIKTGRATLYVPRLPEEYAVWMGPLLGLEDFKKKYEVDTVHYVDEISKRLSDVEPSVLLLLSGPNSDSGSVAKPAYFKGIESFVADSDILFPVIAECRVIKSPAEIEVLRYVARVSSDAHKAVMKAMKPGMHEYQAEAEFLRHSYAVGGCRHVSYTCICGAGTNSAILHYGHAGSPNDCAIQDGAMCLFDMGANYGGYAADITCSFPANGKFTADQRLVYNAVLAARDAVCGAAREGVSWVDMHLLANRVMLEELRKGQLLQGDVDEMMEAGLNAIFQPHGLGHFLGLDVHDVGGYLPGCPERSSKAGVNRLRTARTLKAGMYLTIEPGCYFIEPLLNKAYADPSLSKFLVKENLDRFRNFGGVRIEDDVLITKTGIENFTLVPRTVDEIEAWMAK